MILPSAAAFLAIGMIAGALHYAAIARDADLLVRGGSAMRAYALRTARLLLSATVFAVAARHGELDLLAALIGFVAVRHPLLARLGGGA